MKRSLFLPLIILTGLLYSINIQGQVADTEQLETRIDSLIPAGVNDTTPGLIVGVFQNGELIFSKGYGLANLSYGIPNDPEMVYNIGSVTKQFLGYGFALLHVEGALNIDDPVGKYLEDWPEFKLLNSFHVTHPDIVEDLVGKIADYYQPMRCRIINLYGDKSGNNREPNSRLTSFQKIQKILREKGFRPVIREMGDVGHYTRHEFFNTVFRETDSKYPKIRINKVKNPDFIIAMESAGMHSEKKDKRPEHHAIKQEHATHYTDAFDQLVYWKYRNGKSFHAMPRAGTAA